MNSHAFDEIGYWSEIKLDIVKDYAKAYSTIFSSQRQRKFHHVYIDAFAGAGINISRMTGDFVLGSPLNALSINPPFREFHFIDLDGNKVAALKELIGTRSGVYIYHGDCNDVLLQKVFPKVMYQDYRRGLCLLDPYGLHLNWEVIQTAGRMRSIDMFLNFPIMDMNRNALWRNPERVDEGGIARMNAFWGDDSWRNVAYQPTSTLFGPVDEKADNAAIADAFQTRLRTVAGFDQVSEPLPMRNTKGAVVYYLFFASQKPVAEEIVRHIFNKYKHRGVS
jgi:three-Cys-motif partner protein